jgi:hypothetical protein
MSFTSNVEQMNFSVIHHPTGLYVYKDKYSEVVYRTFLTQSAMPNTGAHETDGFISPVLGIFSRILPSDNFQYIGKISDYYYFIGNQDLANSVLEAIQQLNISIHSNNPYVSLHNFREDFILTSPVSTNEIGDILPVIICQNSYDGSKAASLSYGIAFAHMNQTYTFAFKFGEMKMIHLVSKTTKIRDALNSYIVSFRENISEIIRESFNTRLTENQVLGTLEVLEKLGKRKALEVQEILKSLMSEMPSQSLPSSWQMFMAIVKYSSNYPNLNIKRLLENIAETVLVIPQRMLDILQDIEG